MRSLVRVDNELEVGNSTLRLNVLGAGPPEPDASTIADPREKGRRSRGGRRLLAATVPGATVCLLPTRCSTASPTARTPPVYVYSTDPEVNNWRVSFTRVGTERDYVQSEFTPNGRVFSWGGPDTVNGVLVRNGDHAPARVLVAPGSQQSTTPGGERTFPPGSQAQAEVAWSRLDRNTFTSSAGRGRRSGCGPFGACMSF